MFIIGNGSAKTFEELLENKLQQYQVYSPNKHCNHSNEYTDTTCTLWSVPILYV